MRYVYFKGISNTLIVLSTSAVATVLPCASAQAQETVATAAESTLGDILVTAQRRSERSQDVPMAITALSGSQLQAAGVVDTSQLATVAAGVSIHSTGQALQPHVRGVGTAAFGPGVENPVALYIDNVYIASQIQGLFDLADVAQVAVLKGPQGTLFGRNATGGVIQITTREPEGTLSGQVWTEIDKFATARGNLYVTGPLSENVKANISLSGATQGKGWGRNIATGEERDKLGHDLSARAKLTIDLGAATTIKLAADYRDKGSSMGGNYSLVPGTTLNFAPPPATSGNPWDVDAPFISRSTSHGGGASGEIVHDLGFASLRSITAYRDSTFHIALDSSFSRVPQIDINYTQYGKTLTEELQLSSLPSQKLKWVIGLYYFNDRSRVRDSNVSVYGTVAQFATDFAAFDHFAARTNGTQTTDSYAAFGQTTIPLFGETTNLTLGGRYSHEKRKRTGYQQDSLDHGPFVPVDANGVPVADIAAATLTDRQSANKFTFRVSLDHKVSSDVMLYGSFNRGFKSGGFNLFRIDVPSYRPESIDSWEAGVKSELFDRHLRLNISGFYSTYRDIQVQKFLGPSAVIVNGAKARFYGLDIEGEAVLTDTLRLTGGAEWLNARFTSYPDADLLQPIADGTSFGPVSGSAAGRAVPYAPNFTANLGLHWTKHIDAGRIEASVTDAYTSTVYADPSNYLKTKPYHSLGAVLNWTSSNERLTLGIWGRNLLDKAVPSLQFYVFPLGFGEDYANPPRTFGLTGTFRFGAS